MMVTLMFTGCETVNQTGGCYGFWENSALKRGTRISNQNYSKPYRQCVEETKPHKNTEKRPYG
tara:strand:+ start:870 stop:1058 length:189 start_codon:yes stop_codon:yes gene_type:complete